MDITADWVFPISFGILSTLLIFVGWNIKTAPAKIKKSKTRRQ